MDKLIVNKPAVLSGKRGVFRYYESKEVVEGAAIHCYLDIGRDLLMAFSFDEYRKRGARRRNTRAWYLPPFKDVERINSTRRWQIKNKLNYGRF